MRSIFFLFASFFISLSATARVEVAFLEVYGRDGKPIELEKAGGLLMSPFDLMINGFKRIR